MILKNDRILNIIFTNLPGVGLVLGIFLLILLISLAIYLWRVDWKDKQYRYEEGTAGDSITFPQKKPKLSDSSTRGIRTIHKEP